MQHHYANSSSVLPDERTTRGPFIQTTGTDPCKDYSDTPSAGRISSSIFRQSMSGKDLQEKIKKIEVCGTRLVAQANICSVQRQSLMHEGGKDS